MVILFYPLSHPYKVYTRSNLLDVLRHVLSCEVIELKLYFGTEPREQTCSEAEPVIARRRPDCFFCFFLLVF